MKTTRLRASVILAAIAALLLAGCSGGSDSSTDDEPAAESPAGGGGAPSGTLGVNWGAFPETWSPGMEMEGGPLRIPYETLTTMSPEGEIAPMLATEWEQTAEALTLQLRDDVTFHDGTPFDAEAVKVNIETARAATSPWAGYLSAIESVEVVDEYTVRLNLSEPTPSLLTTLSMRAAPMASPQSIADGSITQNPVGTGPWAYDAEASTPGTRMNFTFYPEYWGGPESVGFETIELYAIPDDNAAAAALAGGEIDVTDTEQAVLPRLEAAPGIETLTYPAIRNNPMFFDRGPGGVFEDADVRRAACHAINIEELVAVEPDIVPQTQHFADGEVGYNPDIEGYPHDLERARELYEQAGSPSVEASVLAAPFNQRQLEVYASQMAEVGIQLDVQVAPPPQFFGEWNSGRYPLGLGSNDELHPYDWYKAWFAADAPGNPAGVESPELEAAADAAIAAGTTPEAEELWAEVTRVISEEALTCAHVVGEELIAYNSEVVQGADTPVHPWEANLINYRDLRPAQG